MSFKIWFRPIMDNTIVQFCILFTMLIVNTKLEHYLNIIFNKCYASLMIVPCHEKNIYYYDKKPNSTTKML